MTPDDPLDSALQHESARYLPSGRPPFEALVARHRTATRVRRTGAALLVIPVVAATAFVVTEVREQSAPPDSVIALPTPTGATSGATPGTPSSEPGVAAPSTWPLPVSDDRCPTGDTSLADYISFVNVGDVMYVQDASGTTAQLGRTILTTRCEYSKGAPGKGYLQQSGDSSYLPVGTAIRELVGFDPRFRVAAVNEGRTLVFQAPPPDGAKTFADVYPGIGEHITGLHVTSQQDGTTVLARLDAGRLPTLIRLLLSAPYAPDAGFNGDDVRLAVRLDDGTTVHRPYDRETGQLLPGVQVPVAFRDAVREALRTSEGQPTPRCIAVPGNYSGPREAEEYVGLTEAAARSRAAAGGLELRILGRDGTCTGERTANSATRVNVDVRDGVVRDAARF